MNGSGRTICHVWPGWRNIKALATGAPRPKARTNLFSCGSQSSPGVSRTDLAMPPLQAIGSGAGEASAVIFDTRAQSRRTNLRDHRAGGYDAAEMRLAAKNTFGHLKVL